MSELLIELFSEEIPALMQKKASQGYHDIFTKGLQEQNLDFDTLSVYVGPRRITIHVTGVPSTIPDRIVKIKGPKTNAPEKALAGFCHSNDIEINQLQRENIKGIEHFIFEQIIDARPTQELLALIIPDLISSYVWPKSMYWGQSKIKWVRPLRNIMCIYNGDVIGFQYGHLVANNKTFGHRFMSKDVLQIVDFTDYQMKMAENFVMLSSKERKGYIWQQAQKLAKEKNLIIKEDPNLLDEVVGLVEYPRVMIGQLEQKFLVVPNEVLISSMRSHQKYFSLYDVNGNFAPYFIFVANIISQEPQIVIEGNEKVLAARLSDALYFYNQDIKTSLQTKVTKLDQVIFHAKLGSLKDKTARLGKITNFLSPENDVLKQASIVCKSDIVSEVVGEFPNLQGIMGYYYAKLDSMNEDVAITIRDHYKPQGPSDHCPQGNAALLALADKMDSLCGLIAAGEKSTGSKDPYALRRYALGIIRIILENKISCNLVELVEFILGQYALDTKCSKELVMKFLEERMKYFFQEYYSQNIIASVLANTTISDLVVVQKKLDSLKLFLTNSNNNDVLLVYRRVHNIVQDTKIRTSVNPLLLDCTAEKVLYKFIQDYKLELTNAVHVHDYSKGLHILSKITPLVSSFFDQVMVNVEDKVLEANRLALLYEIKNFFNKITNFDRL
ncbi:MAG: glycine--tRNA ligase subunit beta [Rickettsiaceae bacterium]